MNSFYRTNVQSDARNEYSKIPGSSSEVLHAISLRHRHDEGADADNGEEEAEDAEELQGDHAGEVDEKYDESSQCSKSGESSDEEDVESACVASVSGHAELKGPSPGPEAIADSLTAGQERKSAGELISFVDSLSRLETHWTVPQ